MSKKRKARERQPVAPVYGRCHACNTVFHSRFAQKDHFCKRMEESAMRHAFQRAYETGETQT